MDDGFDPEAFYPLQRSMFIDKLTYKPKPALVIEVYKSVVSDRVAYVLVYMT